MPFARPNLTRPFPRPVPRRRRVAVRAVGGPGASLSLVFGSWNFLARVWISFDPPNTALPTWIEITGFVETGSSIVIRRGRSDGLADVSAATCSLTVDNSDGRFNAGNPNGVWYGLIRKGCWLKVDILPPSGVVSDRFVGFTTTLPTAWNGQYATGAITASDRYEKLANIPTLPSIIQSEVLTDPNLAGNVKGYWNLRESSGSLTFGDTSGQGARYLAATAAGGMPVGTGMTAGNVTAPGFEGLKCVGFAPISNTQGTYLTTPITAPTGVFNVPAFGYTGLYGTLEIWFQATTTGIQQCIAGIVDTTAQYGMTILIDTSGALNVLTTPTAFASPAGGGGIISGPVADGRWHHAVVALVSTATGGGMMLFSITLDGVTYSSSGLGVSGPGNTLNQLIIGAGYDPLNAGVLRLGACNISDVAWTWADMAGAVNSQPPNIADHYAAGATGFVGESTDQRIARVARYTGVPIPLASRSSLFRGGTGSLFTIGKVNVYNPSKGPWTNLAPGAHACGTQAMVGRGGLDVMREAARTEGMPLFVDRSGYLAIQPSTIRQNTTPAWSVDSRDLETSTAQPDDFAYTTNQATITPNGQAAQTVIGALGRASQARYGIYTNGGQQATASLNPIEAQSLGLSLIQLRADPTPRLAPVVVEAATLATQAGYGAAWYDAVLATEISTPFRVTNMPPQAGGGTLDGFAEGWTETIGNGIHTFAFNTSPVQGPTYQLDDAVLGRLDTDGSTLVAAIAPSATTMLVATTGVGTGSALWTTAGGDFPVDVNVGGEQVTVTGIVNTIGSADGTFESGVAGWFPTWSTPGTWAASSAQAHSGTQSGLLTTPGSLSTMSITSPLFPVAPNTSYTFGYWALLQSGSGNLFGGIDWFRADGSSLGSAATPGLSSPGAWASDSVTATSPATAAFAHVRVNDNVGTSGGLYIDDVTFTPSTSPQLFTAVRQVNGTVGAQLIALGADGTFETGVANWTPTAGTFVQAATAHTSAASGLFTVVGSPSQAYVRTPAIPVTPGVTYTVSLWVLNGSGTPNVQAAIDWRNAGNSYLSTASGTVVAASGAWVLLVVSGTAPAGAAFAVIGPTLPTTPAAGNAIYVDDVTFAQAVGHPAGTPVSVWAPLTLAY